MNYDKLSEVQDYVTKEITKAYDFTLNHTYTMDDDFLQSCLKELRESMAEFGIQPNLTEQAEEQFLTSEYILYGEEYIASNTFFIEFMLLESLGKWNGWKDYYKCKNEDFIRGQTQRMFEQVLSDALAQVSY